MNTKLWLGETIKLAKHAGEAIMAIYQQVTPTAHTQKLDASPVTQADLLAHKIIVEGLQQLTPALPILSEEEAGIAYSERKQWQRYWLLDPLDGTKEFIERHGEFTINIALIEDHKPILGVVYAPVLESCYYASHKHGAFKQVQANPPEKIHSQALKNEKIRVVASRFHGVAELQQFLPRLGEHTILHKGSALKCCLVAEGAADFYPRLTPTSEWDTAAAQCVVEEAGGAMLDAFGKPLRYNTKDSFENPPFFVVGDTQHNWSQYW